MSYLFAMSIVGSVLLSVMYLTYKWTLSVERMHGFNRLVIWTIYIAAVILPFYVVFGRGLLDLLMPSSAVGDVEILMNEFEVGRVVSMDADGLKMPDNTSLFWQILLWVYAIGSVIVVAHTLIVAIKLWTIIRNGKRVTIDGHSVVFIDRVDIAPFSVMHTVVMSRRDYNEAGDMILTHETGHITLNHWVDLLMAQLVIIIQWYNPASWLMRRELRSIHEYQADSRVMTSGVNVKEYQMLLIKKAVGARFPSLANSLNHSNLKKRITMMYKSRVSRWRMTRALVLIPAAAGAVLLTDIPAVANVIDEAGDARMVNFADKVSKLTDNGQGASSADLAIALPASEKPVDSPAVSNEKVETDKVKDDKAKESTPEFQVIGSVGYGAVKNVAAKNEEDAVYSVVDTAPEYPGGVRELMGFVSKNLRYPEEAKRDSIQGRVLVQFVVDKNGKVTSPKIIRGVNEALDQEALRLVGLLPDFEPGKLKGEPVAVEFTLPIAFTLTNKRPSSNGNPEAKSQAPRKKEVSPEQVKEEIRKGNPAFFVNGKRVESIEDIDPKTFKVVDIVKNDKNYPDGAVYITLKSASEMK